MFTFLIFTFTQNNLYFSTFELKNNKFLRQNDLFIKTIFFSLHSKLRQKKKFFLLKESKKKIKEKVHLFKI